MKFPQEFIDWLKKDAEDSLSVDPETAEAYVNLFRLCMGLIEKCPDIDLDDPEEVERAMSTTLMFLESKGAEIMNKKGSLTIEDGTPIYRPYQ